MTRTPVATALPDAATQVRRLIDLGLAERAGLDAGELDAAAAHCSPGSLLVVAPQRIPPSELAPLLPRDGRPGFVVTDMTDVDSFAPIAGVEPPDGPVYALEGVDRGDEYANWSPDEALPAIVAAGRTPLTLIEGVHWLLQQPEALERNHCFMTVGSRLTKPNGRLDARTPAIWISNGTGRDGKDRRHATKLGWCWAGNRHTWLGMASATRRRAVTR